MLKFEIESVTLSATVEAMRDLQERYELEAAALARIAQECPEAHRLAVERAEAAEMARGLFDFYVGL